MKIKFPKPDLNQARTYLARVLKLTKSVLHTVMNSDGEPRIIKSKKDQGTTIYTVMSTNTTSLQSTHAITLLSLCYFYNLEPSKLEGCWSAHPRCAWAVSQLVVERQYRRSVSCNVIARADCLVTGGVSGHYGVTCSSFGPFYIQSVWAGHSTKILSTPPQKWSGGGGGL